MGYLASYLFIYDVEYVYVYASLIVNLSDLAFARNVEENFMFGYIIIYRLNSKIILHISFFEIMH